jgi:cation:H+ antiporter
VTWIEGTHLWAPWLFLGVFLAASFLMLWRLEAMTKSGVEGTVLGTLVMPYCSGMGNLMFAFVLGTKGGPGEDVLTNSLVNNVTNMTLLIGLPAIFWSMNLLPSAKPRKKKTNIKGHQINRLSLLLTLTAVLFFTGATWALARDGEISAGDGIVLVGLFLFWQCFHIFDVMKSNVLQNKSFSWMLPLDLAILGIGAYGIYLSTDWLVTWLSSVHNGIISAKYLGWLSGWLMVLPNGLLAFYYAWRGNPEVVYTSQIGDGHISIPLCIGIFALYRPISVPSFFQTGVMILLGAALVHFFFVALLGRLPRLVGWVLTAAYGVFLYKGLGK